MERHGYGNEYPCWSKREGELPTRGMSFWTSIPRDNPWVRSQPCAQTGVPRRVPAGARSSAAGCCGARWPRSLLRYVTAAEAAIARRSARSVRICQEPAPYGVGSAPGPQAADWEWGNRKCRATRGQFALARPESLLGSRQCRGHPPVAVVRQSGSVEQVETYGYFTPCFARSLIGKMGTHPLSSKWSFRWGIFRSNAALPWKTSNCPCKRASSPFLNLLTSPSDGSPWPSAKNFDCTIHSRCAVAE